MQRVLVFNDNVHPLEQMFKGNEVKIAAKDYWRGPDGEPKVFDIFEANEFRGSYLPGPLDTNGKLDPDPKYYKMVRLDVVGKSAPAPEQFPCMAPGCKEQLATAKALEVHSKESHGSIETLSLPDEDAALQTKKAKK